jgi:bifunctional non-homologous end joining protein LigD
LREGKQWLLIKGGENHHPISAKLDDTSAASGKSMRQLSQSARVWQSNGKATESESSKKNGRSQTKAPKRNPSEKFAFVEPMKARLVDRPPTGEWLYEIKFDGYRALAFKRGKNVRLLSRNEKDFSAKFPEVAEAVTEFDADDAILDGEIVALDGKGRSSFQLLQALELNETHPPLFYYVFDLLRLDGKDLTGLRITDRKALLEKHLKKEKSLLRFSASLPGGVKDLLKKVGRLGLEGLIGKRADSIYEPGRRSGAWVKLKLHQEQEMIIGGYTPPGGSRQHFGALLLGYYENKKLTFAGRVGTGFDDKMLRELHARFEKLSASACPFANLPEEKSARYGQSLTPAEMKKCHWLQPKLVCQVKFAEWTRDGKLRQPVFLGLREDKSPADVIRERPASL